MVMVGSSLATALWVKEASGAFSIPNFTRCFSGKSFSVSYRDMVLLWWLVGTGSHMVPSWEACL